MANSLSRGAEPDPEAETADILRAARALIDTPKKWNQGGWAKASDGAKCGEMDQEAACFCALGAISRSGGGWEINKPAVKLFAAAIGGEPITPWNDRIDTTHDEVMAAFDRAIAMAEGAPNGR